MTASDRGETATRIEVESWPAFESHLRNLRDCLPQGSAKLLFRGVGNAEFGLTTTLERAGCHEMSFGDYYRLVATRLKPGVETFTGANWDLPAYGEIEETFQDHELFPFGRFPSVELYRYLVYLRHHGFPSPLLDWSQSPYVAAFFAFRDSPPEGPEKRSIYAYCETQTGIRGGAVGEPMIRAIGPYVRSHRRHFRQQSNYTICGRFDSTWLFHNHEKVFSSPRPEQDRLWKFDLPSLERSSVLQSLDEYNLNAFSLFDTDESLMETMWLREQTFRI